MKKAKILVAIYLDTEIKQKNIKSYNLHLAFHLNNSWI